MNDTAKKDEYQEYLASVHAKLSVPEEVVSETVEEATGSQLESTRRIFAGEVNAVYEVTPTVGPSLILRIADKGHPEFQQEIWSIGKAREAGVPVPEIVLVKYITISEQPRALCLMEKVQGEPLERGNINFDELDIETQKDLIKQAGGILARIHSIPTEGFGWIVEDHGEFQTAAKLLENLLSKRDQLQNMAQAEGISPDDINRALEIILGFEGWYSGVSPRLNHGDYSNKHLMMENNQIIGIIDWGGVRSDTPIYDFANWDYWFGDQIPTEWLKNGYTDRSIFTEKFDDTLHMIRLWKGLEVLDWYHKEGYKPAVEKAKAKLQKDLDYFKSQQ